MTICKANNGEVDRSSKTSFVQHLVLVLVICGFHMAAGFCTGICKNFNWKPNFVIAECCVSLEDSMKLVNSTRHYGLFTLLSMNVSRYTKNHFPNYTSKIQIIQDSPFTFDIDAFSGIQTDLSFTLIGLDFDLTTPFIPANRFQRTVHVIHMETTNVTKKGPIFLTQSFLESHIMSGLSNLSLPRNGIYAISKEFLKDARTLILFDLSHNYILKMPACFQVYVPGIINLAHNKIRTVENNDILHAGCPLKSLDLSYNILQTIQPQALNKQCQLANFRLEGNLELKCVDKFTFDQINPRPFIFDIDVSYTLIDELSFLQPLNSTIKKKVNLLATQMVCDCQMEDLVKSAESIAGTCLWTGNVMVLGSSELTEKWNTEGCASIKSPRQCSSSRSGTVPTLEKPSLVANTIDLNPTQVTVITSTLILISLIIFGVTIFLDSIGCWVEKPVKIEQAEDDD